MSCGWENSTGKESCNGKSFKGDHTFLKLENILKNKAKAKEVNSMMYENICDRNDEYYDEFLSYAQNGVYLDILKINNKHLYLYTLTSGGNAGFDDKTIVLRKELSCKGVTNIASALWNE